MITLVPKLFLLSAEKKFGLVKMRSVQINSLTGDYGNGSSPPLVLPSFQTGFALPSSQPPLPLSAPTVSFQPQPSATGGLQLPMLGAERSDFIRADSGLSEGEGKYCRCLLKAEAKGKAYSPYGVCTKSTGHQVHSCSQYYDWSAMSLEMLLAYCTLHKLDISGIGTREQALAVIRNWKAGRGETF